MATKLTSSEVRKIYHVPKMQLRRKKRLKISHIITSSTNVIEFKVKCKNCKRVYKIDNKPYSYIQHGFTCPNCYAGVQGVYDYGRNIPNHVKTIIEERDNKRCVYCNHRGSKNNPLEYGHHLPHSSGGCVCARNMQIECFNCNRRKAGNYVVVTNKTVEGCRRKCFNKNNKSKRPKIKYQIITVFKKFYGHSLVDVLNQL